MGWGRRRKHGLKQFAATVAQVNALESSLEREPDAELRARTEGFRRRVAAGEDLERLLPEAFATFREAGRRALGTRCRDEQVIGAAALNGGVIAEVRRGEGRSLMAGMAAYLNALGDGTVHIMARDQPTADRYAQSVGLIHRFLEVEVGTIHDSTDEEQRRLAREADISYGTPAEFVYCVLRDSFTTKRVPASRAACAIVHNADAVLLDGVDVTYTVTQRLPQERSWYEQFARLAPDLEEGVHYRIEAKKKARIQLSDEGVRHVESRLGIEDLERKDEPGGLSLADHLRLALRAKHYQHYVVQDGAIRPLHWVTGQVMDAHLIDGMHEALEAKEGLELRHSRTVDRIPAYSQLRCYSKLAGLTATAAADAEAFRSLYDLDVVQVPPHFPVCLTDHEDWICVRDADRWAAVAEWVAGRHAKGQPVLIDTTSAENTAKLSDGLTRRGIQHRSLHGAEAESSSELLADAGRRAAVTVATKLAATPVRIRLGGSAATAEEAEAVARLGGLAVVGSERRTFRRHDDRVRDLATWQDQPGESVFFCCFEDPALRPYQKATFVNIHPGPEAGIARALKRALARQAAAYWKHHRQTVARFSLEQAHRQAVIEVRDEAFAGEESQTLARDCLHAVVTATVRWHFENRGPTADRDDLGRWLAGICGVPIDLSGAGDDVSAVLDSALAQADAAWNDRRRSLGQARLSDLWRLAVLDAVDRAWPVHLEALDRLVNGDKPPTTFADAAEKERAHTMYDIRAETVRRMMNHPVDDI